MERDDMSTPGEVIRAARVALGLTPQDVAERVGVSRNTVYGWENGVSVPDSGYYKALVEVLQISLNDLFDIPSRQMSLTDEETLVIQSYRKNPDMQQSVKKLLDITDN